jgi:hypothetical protein
VFEDHDRQTKCRLVVDTDWIENHRGRFSRIHAAFVRSGRSAHDGR